MLMAVARSVRLATGDAQSEYAKAIRRDNEAKNRLHDDFVG